MAVRRIPTVSPENTTTIVVDLSPEFRIQAVAAEIKRLDAVLFSHDHADQSHGIDDIRAFAYRQRSRVPCWADQTTIDSLTARFPYIYNSMLGYPAIADAVCCPAFGEPFSIDGPSGAIPVIAYDMDHGNVRATGYRFADVAYSSDVVGLPDGSKALLQGLDVFVVDALRHTPHPSHAHLDLALQWIEELKPRRAFLTNLHVDMDYQTLRRSLPEGVEPAFDGLTFTSPVATNHIQIADNIP